MPAPLARPPARSAASDEIRASPAALWRRAAAFLVDAIVVGGGLGTLLLLATSISGAHTTDLHGFDGLLARMHAMQRIWIPGLVLGGVLSTAYCALSAFLFGGRTLGRAALGIRLVDPSGHPPRPARAILRAALSALSVLVCFAGFWWALFDRRGQAVHDKLTSTFVVR